MLVKTKMINLLESNGVTAEYISGEREAFEELAREVRKAKRIHYEQPDLLINLLSQQKPNNFIII